MQYILRNATIVTMSNRGIVQGDLLIVNDKIKDIGKNIMPIDMSRSSHPYPADHIEIDMSGKVIIPGLIQTHVHLCQTLFRNKAENLKLLPWLKEKIWPLEASHTKETLGLSAELGIAELLLSGTTTILDMGTVHNMEAVFEVVKYMKIRAVIGKTLMDDCEGAPAALTETTAQAFNEACQLIGQYHNTCNQRIKVALAPRFLLSASKELYTICAAEARRTGCLLHTHTSEQQSENQAVRTRFNQESIEFLNDTGFLGSSTVLAHCIFLSDSERELIRRTGTHIAHCPSSNLKLGSGICDVSELLRDGVNVTLGADGAACNNRLDIFTEMRQAALLQSVKYGPDSITAKQIFEMATIRGASALGMSKTIGSIQEGKKADLVVLDLNQVHNVPLSKDLYTAIVYTADSRNVEQVWVDGERVVHNKRLLVSDVDEIVQRVNGL